MVRQQAGEAEGMIYVLQPGWSERRTASAEPMRFKTSSKFVEYCHPEIQVHNQYKQLSTMFNFISDMFFNSDPYQNETLLVFSF